MIKKVFISLPMSGKEHDEIGNRLKEINHKVKQACVKKFGWLYNDICTIDNFWDCQDPYDGYLNMIKRGHENLYFLGQAVQKLGMADAVYFDEGWQNAKGCNVERYVCLKYQIPIIDWNEWLGGPGEAEEKARKEVLGE